MLSTEPMCKVRVICLDEDKKRAVDTLHELGIIDLRKSKLKLEDDAPSQYYNQIAELLVKYEGLMQIMKKQPVTKRYEHMSLERLIEVASKNKAAKEGYALSERLKEINEKIKEFEYALYLAKGFERLNINLAKIKSERTSIMAYSLPIKGMPIIERLKAKEDIAASISQAGEEVFVLFAVEKGKEQEVEEAMSRANAKSLDLEKAYNARGRDAVKELSRKLAKLEKEKEENERRLDELSKRHYGEIAALVEMLRIEFERASVSSYFKKTQKTAVMEGWIPEKRFEELRSKLALATSGRVEIEKLEKDELPPTLLGRKGILHSFDYGVEFFGEPRSDELDPTWPFIISFLVFYGFMVSDVGYGIASFLFATWVTKKTNPKGMTYNAARLWQIGAIPAIIFGIITNQYFGFRLDQYFLPFSGIDWMKNLPYFLIAAILLGLAEIGIGLIFGFINKYRHGEKKKAYSKLFGLFMMVFGTMYVMGAFFNMFNSFQTLAFGISAALFLFASAFLAGKEGPEVMSVITHILSYARLMGFGVTSVIIAYLIDMAFTPTLSHGILMFVLFAVIFVALHMANMIVGIFEGIVQGVRLNVVEFFSKFFIGGGIKFKPFEVERTFTKVKK